MTSPKILWELHLTPYFSFPFWLDEWQKQHFLLNSLILYFFLWFWLHPATQYPYTQLCLPSLGDVFHNVSLVYGISIQILQHSVSCIILVICTSYCGNTKLKPLTFPWVRNRCFSLLAGQWESRWGQMCCWHEGDC